MTTIEKILGQMLTESTGRHFLDSGGAYGRAWERNRGRVGKREPHEVFEEDEPVRLSFSSRFSEVEVTISAYHFLKEALEYDEKADEFFQAFSDLCWIIADRHYEWAKTIGDILRPTRVVGLRCFRWLRNEIKPRNSAGYGPPWSHLMTMELFPDYLRSIGYLAGGIYGDGRPMTVNTYNGEDLLSQTLQYTYFSLHEGERAKRGYEMTCSYRTCGNTWRCSSGEPDESCPKCGASADYEYADPPIELWDGAYVLLQIHGGCDVRGGYTNPRLFSCGPEHDETRIFDNARAVIYCSRCESNWSTDDGCHWYADGCCGASAGKQLEDYDFILARKPDDPDGPVVAGPVPAKVREALETYDINHLRRRDYRGFMARRELKEAIEEDKKGMTVDPLFVDEDGTGYCPHCGHRLVGGMY